MIGLYNGSVEVGNQSGALVSSSNRVTFVLNSSLNEEKEQVLAIRTLEENHKTVGETVVALEGASKAKWALSLDGETWGNYGESITITEEIRNANKLIYVKAKAVEGEGAATDVSVSIKITATIGTIA